MNLASPTPKFVKLTHLISLGSVTIATYIRLPCLVKIRITIVVINNKGSTAIPHSVLVKDVTEFNDQVRFSPIMYLMRRPRRSVFFRLSITDISAPTSFTVSTTS